MTDLEQKRALKKEWDIVKKKEERFFAEQKEKKDSALNRMLEQKVPEKLQATLDAAFSKAFTLVFHRGTAVIEKTYRKEAMKEAYEINSYAIGVKKGAKGLRAFSKNAGRARAKNLAVSSVEGIGLGILGIGLPDIPIFVAVVLKNMYELALNYGYTYESDEERRWILLLIRGAFIYGEDLEQLNREADCFIRERKLPEGWDQKSEIKKTAAELSKELLYMKFLQGIPVAGAAGGIYNVIYLRKIQRYAGMKYRKRFLYDQARNMVKQEHENGGEQGAVGDGAPDCGAGSSAKTTHEISDRTPADPSDVCDE